MDVCKPGYPKRVFFIIGNEFCERFCYYGMRAILQSYLMLKLGLDADTAGALYHAFAIVSYFMPLPGAIVADSFLGKYWTIFSLSIVYVIGNIIMSTTAIGPGYLAGALVGMFTIAVGTGGIKPCVSSFGADQFTAEQSKMQKSFFSMFYIAVNAGSLLSQFITPIVKSTPCFGEEECWVLAFGLPAVLMIVAVIFFVIGTPFYTRVPVKENVIVLMTGAVTKAIGRSCGKHKRKVDHWLDRAVPDYSQEFVDDCKAVFRVLILFVPLPFFWALFDQSGSRWTYMAQKMSTYVDFLNVHLEPEQIQIANALLIVILVPIFEVGVYPLLAKCNFLTRPLQRLVAGCVLAALSFVVIGLIQIDVQNKNDVVDQYDMNTFRTRVFNVDPNCSFTLGRQVESEYKIDSTLFQYETFLYEGLNGTELIFDNFSCPNGNASLVPLRHTISLDSSSPFSSIFYYNGRVDQVYGNNSFPMSERGEPQDEFLFQILLTSYSPNTEISQVSFVYGQDRGVFTSNGYTVPSNLAYDTAKTPSYYYNVKYKIGAEEFKHETDFKILQGGAYMAYVYKNGTGDYQVEVLQDKGDNKVSAFLQVIPYFIITCAEILFSITGLSFAFSQAPASMKAILTSGWLLTSSFGNIIDMIIISISIPDKAVEFFLFAGLMVVVTIVFAIMTCFYTYVEDIERDEEKSISQTSSFDKESLSHKKHAKPMASLPSLPYLIADPEPEGENYELQELPKPPAPVHIYQSNEAYETDDSETDDSD